MKEIMLSILKIILTITMYYVVFFLISSKSENITKREIIARKEYARWVEWATATYNNHLKSKIKAKVKFPLWPGRFDSKTKSFVSYDKLPEKDKKELSIFVREVIRLKNDGSPSAVERLARIIHKRWVDDSILAMGGKNVSAKESYVNSKVHKRWNRYLRDYKSLTLPIRNHDREYAADFLGVRHRPPLNLKPFMSKIKITKEQSKKIRLHRFL